MIIDEIKKANMQAMKDRNVQARAIYGVVMNKAMLNKIEKKEKGLEQTDADLVAILQKTIKELDEEKENYIKAGNNAQAENVLKQKNLISVYLPKMLSEDEIRSVIGALEDKSIPSIMKHFKANFNGKVDMGTVNKIAREFN